MSQEPAAPGTAAETQAEYDASIAAITSGDRGEPVPMEDADPDRRRFIGGSDMAAIMGFGATYDGEQQTAYTVYLKKTAETRGEMDADRRRFLERRKRWEPVVVQMLREEFDAEIVSVNRRYVDPEHDFLAAEIDFEWRDSEGNIQNGEIKTVSPFAFGERFGWGETGSGDIPMHYETQVQHGMGVMGPRRTVCAVAAMVGLDEMIFYRVPRKDHVIHEMRKRAGLFWRESILARVPPTPQTLGDLRGLFPKSNGLEVAADSEIGLAALRLRAIRGEIDARQMEADVLEFQVKEALGDGEALTVGGRRVFTWKSQAWSRFDVSALKGTDDKEEKKVYRKYLKDGTHRVFKGAAWKD